MLSHFLAPVSHLFEVVLVQAEHLQAAHVLERLLRQLRPTAVDAVELYQVGLIQKGAIQPLGYGIVAQVEKGQFLSRRKCVGIDFGEPVVGQPKALQALRSLKDLKF